MDDGVARLRGWSCARTVQIEGIADIRASLTTEINIPKLHLCLRQQASFDLESVDSTTGSAYYNVRKDDSFQALSWIKQAHLIRAL